MPTELTDLADALWITHAEWAGEEPPLRAPVLRRTFTLEHLPAGARITISGLGVWDAHLNGRPVSDAVLEPGTSEYRIRVATTTWDITPLLVAGRNELIIELGEGAAHVRDLPDRYTKFAELRIAPRVRAAVVLSGENGSTQVIPTGPDWGAMLGPTTVTHWYGGEDYDARLEPSGWLTITGTDDSVWQHATVVGSADEGPVPWERAAPPMRVVERIEELERQHTGNGAVLDFGRNMAGRQEIRLADDFPAGATVEMWPSEYLHATGRVNQSTTGEPIFDRFTSAGRGETWRPRFNYHGFRYLELRIRDTAGAPLPEAAKVIQVTAERIMTDDLPVGDFTTSDATLKGVDDLVTRAAQSNFVSVPTDCPHREKLGWLEQLHLVFSPLAFRWDVREHLSDMVVHMSDAQTPDGLVPDIAPELVVFQFAEEPGFRDDINWGSAIVQVPYWIYRTYGDLKPALAAWEPGLRYINYIERLAGDGLLDHGLADWITLDSSTPRALVASYGHASMLEAAATLGDALGHPSTAVSFRTRATEIRSALHDRYVFRDDEGRLIVGSGSQASYALLMDLGVLDGIEYAEAARALVDGIVAADAQITVGEIALPSLVRVLTALGEHELLYRMVTRTEGPGYGKMLADGETALAEHWTGGSTNGSANHFMLGYISEWLTSSVAGLAPHRGSIAWTRALLAPVPLAAVDSASARHRSAVGEYAIAWERSGEMVLVAVTVPADGTAEFVMPAGFIADDGDRIELGPGEHEIKLVPVTVEAGTR